MLERKEIQYLNAFFNFLGIFDRNALGFSIAVARVDKLRVCILPNIPLSMLPACQEELTQT